MKVYPAKEVVPFRSPVQNTIKSLKMGEATNFPHRKRTTVMSAITRLHNSTDFKFRTVKISETEFAVIREK